MSSWIFYDYSPRPCTFRGRTRHELSTNDDKQKLRYSRKNIVLKKKRVRTQIVTALVYATSPGAYILPNRHATISNNGNGQVLCNVMLSPGRTLRKYCKIY